MDTTGRGLLQFWERMPQSGQMKRGTANAFRASVKQIVQGLENWETRDVSDLRAEEIASLLQRFEKQRKNDYEPATLEQYKKRFQRALDIFLDSATDPRSRAPWPKQRIPKRPVRGTRTAQPADAAPGPIPSRLQEMTAPLPGGRTAILRLPRDLRLSDLERLKAFMAPACLDYTPSK